MTDLGHRGPNSVTCNSDGVDHMGKLLQVHTLSLIDYNNSLINLMKVLGMYSDVGLFSTVLHRTSYPVFEC